MVNRMLLFLSIILTCIMPTLSDMRSDSEWSIGFKGGLNIGSMFGTQKDFFVDEYGNDLSFKDGIDFGIFLQYSPLKFFGLSIELLFTTKGYEATFYSNEVIREYMEAIRNYFELPLIAKIQAPFPRRYNPYIFFGTGPALNVTAKNRYKVTKNNSSSFDSDDIDIVEPVTINLHDNSTASDDRGNIINYTFNDFHRWFDLPFVFGLGHVISFSKLAIVINTRFSLSLLGFNRLSSSMKKELNSKRIIYTELDEKYIHISVLAGLAYKF